MNPKIFSFTNSCIMDNCIYCIIDKTRRMTFFDLKEYRLNIDKRFSDIKFEYIPDRMCTIKKKIYVIGESLFEINTENGHLTKRYVFDKEKTGSCFAYFGKGKGEELVIVPRIGNLIYLYNLETNQIIDHKMINEENALNGFKTAKRENGHIFLLGENLLDVFIYDIYKNTDVCYRPLKYTIGGLCVIEGGLLLLTNQGELVKWDYVNGHIEKLLENVPSDNHEMIATRDKIFLLPDQGSDIFYIYNGKLEKYYDYPSDFTFIGDVNWSKYVAPVETNECVYYPMRSCNYLMIILKNESSIEWKRVEGDEFIEHEMVKIFVEENIIEERDLSLKEYLNAIKK